MNINERLYVEIHPLTSGQIPHPHPVDEAHFDPAYVYKVLGMYNPSETSECYLILSNTQRQIWFISQRHLLAYALVDSDEFFIPLNTLSTAARNGHDRLPVDRQDGGDRKSHQNNGQQQVRRVGKHMIT